ncbi:MAG: M20/M25/M40 family metallo-hydrolase [Clostridium sp.]|nr:M20/M25/M40 family metallo-hydrolase [Clostridium sp.]
MVNKRRLIEEFIELVKIDSITGKEKDIAQLLYKKLEELGFEVLIDNAGELAGGETGNVIATLKGNRPGKKLLFTSHMDTVEPGISINPIIDETQQVIKSDGTTILGSDDKAGIAAILEAMRTLKEKGLSHPDIQIVFSIWEEQGLLGAKYLDYSKIDADYIYVLDMDGPVGRIITKASAQDKIDVKILGKSAHAGLNPENGISALMVASNAIENMKLLRIDEETTANFGVINGGVGTNSVMSELTMSGEARSLSEEKLKKQVNHMIDCFRESAKKYSAEVRINVNRVYDAVNIKEDDEVVLLAKKAFANLGIKSYTDSTGGASDVNIYAGKGYKVVNLAIGMTNAHSVNEFIKIEDLYNSSRVVLEIIKEA